MDVVQPSSCHCHMTYQHQLCWFMPFTTPLLRTHQILLISVLFTYSFLNTLNFDILLFSHRFFFCLLYSREVLYTYSDAAMQLLEWVTESFAQMICFFKKGTKSVIELFTQPTCSKILINIGMKHHCFVQLWLCFKLIFIVGANIDNWQYCV